ADRMDSALMAQLPGQHMRVADGAPLGGRLPGDFTTQPMTHVMSDDAAPYRVQRLTRGGSELRHRRDSMVLQTLLHVPPDAAEVAQLQSMQAVGQIILLDDETSIRLSHVGS